MYSQDNDYDVLYQLLGYQFQNQKLLQQALTRKSGFLEGAKSVGHNERLEFLGDSILRTVVDDILMSVHPNFGEDKLSPARDRWVSKNGFLCITAENLRLEEFIIMGKGEQNNYRSGGKNKILSDTMEAIIAAIFLDSKKDYAVIKKFIVRHAELNRKKDYVATKRYDNTPVQTSLSTLLLFNAISEGNLSEVNNWLTLGADPNDVQEMSYSISCPCCPSSRGIGWTEIRCSSKKSSPLDLAVRQLGGLNQNTLAIVELLLKHGANPNNLNGFTYPLLHETIIYYPKHSENSAEIFTKLCELFCRYHANINLRANAIHCINGKEPKSGFTPLECAIIRNNYRQVIILLQHGANPNSRNPENGETSLHLAARYGNSSIVKALLQNNGNKTISDKEGFLPWSDAATSTIESLLKPVIHRNPTQYAPGKITFVNNAHSSTSSEESEDDSSISQASQVPDTEKCTLQ